MNAIICEICGSNDLVKQDGLFVCQHCGTKYTVEEARNLLGTVKIDKSEESQNCLTLARRAREIGDDASAEKYYAQVLLNDPNHWEAAYYSIHAKVRQCRIMDITPSVHMLLRGVNTALALIRDNIPVGEERTKAYATVIDDATGLMVALYNAAENHYLDIDQ